jgi:hypothetical protein
MAFRRRTPPPPGASATAPAKVFTSRGKLKGVRVALARPHAATRPYITSVRLPAVAAKRNLSSSAAPPPPLPFHFTFQFPFSSSKNRPRLLLHPWPPAKVAVDVSTYKRTEPGRRRGKPLCLGDIDLRMNSMSPPYTSRALRHQYSRWPSRPTCQSTLMKT